jgi:hypothetical protein
MALALSRLERAYVTLQSDFNTVPTFGNANAIRHIKATAKNNISTLVRRDKTGARTATVGVRGRGYGQWTYEGSLAPSGVNGTQADFDPIFQSVFGQAAASANGGLQYSFVDEPILTFGLALYRTPSTLNQKIAYGCSADTTTFNIGQDIAEFTSEGECKFVVESDYFGAATTDELGGLSSFPGEPGAPVTHGGIIAGFTGLISIGGNTIVRIRTATVKIVNGVAVIKDNFGAYTPQDDEGDVRTVTTSFTMYEDDTDAQKALREASITKVPVDCDYTVGTVAGSIVQFQLKNVQLASYDSDDSARRYSLTFPESRAYGTSISSKDEAKITLK